MLADAVIDARTPITMWELLIWAYKREMVHYEPDHHIGPQMPLQAANFASLAANGQFRGCYYESWSINGAGTTAHEDAHTVHSAVLALGHRRADLVVKAAAAGSVPDWCPKLPAYRIVPVRKGGSGSPRHIYGKNGRPIACMIDYEGIPDHEIARIHQAARESYSLWWAALRDLRLGFVMKSAALKRWKITKTGALREPWNG